MRSISIILLILAGIFFNLNVVAQKRSAGEAKKDSYKSVKSRASVRDAQLLLNEAEKVRTKNPKAALDNVQEALAMSIAEEDVFTEGKSYLLIGAINEDIQEWKLALDNYSRAREKLIDFRNSTEFKRALTGLGNTNLKLSQFDEALRYLHELLGLNLNSSEKAECQLAISEVYYSKGDYAEALKVVNGIQDSNKAVSSLDIRIQNQKAKIYAQQNELDKTQKLYSNSLQNQRASGAAAAPTRSLDQQSTQEAKEEIAGALKEQERYDDEINLRKQSIEFNTESNDLSAVAQDKVAISKTLEVKGELPAALKEAEEAAAIADSIDDPKEQANAYLSLADLYQKNGKNTQALSAYKKYSHAVIENEKQNQVRLTEKSALIQKQKDIEELSKDVSIGQREATIQQQTVFRQQLVIYGLILLIVIVGVASWFTYRSAQASKIANQMLALKSLRSQMNPHFIFNALNSVNHFVAQQDERTANKFLSEFSQLMRLVLENSQEDFIPLVKEQEILTLYLKLEHYRFRDKFDYEINLDDNISTDSVEVPPMLIQPYIENAVWHGLRYKETKGKLVLNISTEDDFLVVEIVDDGIGRKKSAELKTANQRKHNSTGLKNIQERLQIINKVYKTDYRVSIDDLTEQGGTRVRIYLPITKIQAA
jgi:tetratricopeptide (TPR) repeat protein